MNTYSKCGNNWYVYSGDCQFRDLKWYEWIDLRLIQLRNWIYLLGKEK